MISQPIHRSCLNRVEEKKPRFTSLYFAHKEDLENYELLLFHQGIRNNLEFYGTGSITFS